ncbi:ribosomal RNA small subunit methyltransferase A [Candidatus Kuenenbacteria bacterium CG_4_9_14_3_um_filter_39_14]|uniref:Ribosomal RNA small subunit methyltransferase A n=4 Tax=Candidatus Kueneniibacteriota TaxID=1752740 RepID=A0A2M7MH45_9BACT|nr:ribosomal RNA small subunit methyltransferase A [Candidatus Kuenenbacteria bacterium]OIP56939.1 MAG: ribosomal RNA small subunit methyltransferase A [Candidatus Kuenenbacteria bacterium CG2_30_39_24]PIP76000.1 MAG: ribosomal RNA small subunit methyltransferase A [Candidatus Kuenenbacteria bacterium CG22_combo_CG10-13_8_21_14_all_39_9]PIX92327.1 MAG: ribosomal RNA small subunit methyltransferase A [Candidatus Kuenenbacteria bacterium CG_4_10_14_3_um_filter_39_14]PJA91822.1 MAG: ribosomal RNA 
MSITSINHIKDICKELEIWPAKSKGQNFLVSESVRDRIIQAAELNKDDLVLEIGPGLGVLTEELIKKSKVVAVELDKKLYFYLTNKIKNLELIQADVLEFLDGKDKFNKVVANLPYQITSHVLRMMLEKNTADEYILMVQREVGERMVAKPGRMSLLSVMAQYYSEPKILFSVSKGNFWPQPKVDSVVVKLKVKSSPPISSVKSSRSLKANQPKAEKLKVNDEIFFRVVKAGFSAKRKMLKNNLGGIYGIEKVKQALKEIGLDEKVRAQEISVDKWIELGKKL